MFNCIIGKSSVTREFGDVIICLLKTSQATTSSLSIFNYPCPTWSHKSHVHIPMTLVILVRGFLNFYGSPPRNFNIELYLSTLKTKWKI